MRHPADLPLHRALHPRRGAFVLGPGFAATAFAICTGHWWAKDPDCGSRWFGCVPELVALVVGIVVFIQYSMWLDSSRR